MHDNWPEVVEHYAVGTNNARGLKLFQCYAINDLFIDNSIFKPKEKEDTHGFHRIVQKNKFIT